MQRFRLTLETRRTSSQAAICHPASLSAQQAQSAEFRQRQGRFNPRFRLRIPRLSFAQAPVTFTVGSSAVSLTVTTGANLTSVEVGEPVAPSVQLTAAGGIRSLQLVRRWLNLPR